MPRGEKLLKLLASLMLRGLFGTVTMRFEAGKVTHVETEARQMWRYKDLPDGTTAVSLGSRYLLLPSRLNRERCKRDDPSVTEVAMRKTEAEYLKYLWPMRHYLVTCGSHDRANIIAVSFCMPVSRVPPVVASAIGQEMYSCELIGQTGEFVINVPTQDLKRHIYYCGFHSGRDVDKFKETGLTPQPARHVSVPVIAECVAHMECCVQQAVDTGDKRLFIARVVDAYADEDVAQGRRTVQYSAGDFPEKVYGTRFTCQNSDEAQ